MRIWIVLHRAGSFERWTYDESKPTAVERLDPDGKWRTLELQRWERLVAENLCEMEREGLCDHADDYCRMLDTEKDHH